MKKITKLSELADLSISPVSSNTIKGGVYKIPCNNGKDNGKVTTQALGEESNYNPFPIVTSAAIGEESGCTKKK